VWLRLGAGLADQPFDILIGQPGGNDPCPRFAAARDQLVQFDRDRDPIVWIETSSTAILSTVVSITSLLRTASGIGFASSPES
jgi:hypothetical protein